MGSLRSRTPNHIHEKRNKNMTKKKSYNQKAAVFWSVYKSNPKITAKALQDRYRGTKFSMRKQDIQQLLKGFKQSNNYKDAKATTKHSLKSTAKKVKIGQNFTILESPTYVLPEEEQENLEYLAVACEKAFKDGMSIFKDHKGRYQKYQIQLMVLTEIEKDNGEHFLDCVSSNAFPLELNITFPMMWDSFNRNLNKLTQSLLGRVTFIETKTKLIFWHR